MNEFYTVVLYSEDDFLLSFFKDKNNAFNFLWQKFLNLHGDKSDEFIQEAETELYESYHIASVGEIVVCGFED